MIARNEMHQLVQMRSHQENLKCLELRSTSSIHQNRYSTVVARRGVQIHRVYERALVQSFLEKQSPFRQKNLRAYRCLKQGGAFERCKIGA